MIKRIVLWIVGVIVLVATLLCIDGQVNKDWQKVQESKVQLVVLPILIVSEPTPTVSSVSENETVIEESKTINKEEHELLAHLIFAEAGSDWCSDEMQLYVGSVVLNRMAHEEYPDEMYDVIYDEGQYSCTWNGMIEYEYNERAYECAKFLLTNGSQLPSNVVFQAPFEQGDGTYKQVQNMYFCYIEEGEE